MLAPYTMYEVKNLWSVIVIFKHNFYEDAVVSDWDFCTYPVWSQEPVVIDCDFYPYYPIWSNLYEDAVVSDWIGKEQKNPWKHILYVYQYLFAYILYILFHNQLWIIFIEQGINIFTVVRDLFLKKITL